MPKAFAGEDAAITQGQTTAVGADTQAEQPVLEGQATEQSEPAIWGGNTFLWVVVIAMWAWWFFGNKKRKIQREQEKKDRERRNSLEKGDRVVTIGRMHGKVVAFTEKTVTIKPDDKSDCSMIFDREALLRVLPRPGEEAEETAADGAAQS